MNSSRKKNEVQLLVGEDCKRLEALWREVFFEDSDRFTSYYFQYKANKNIALAIGNNETNYIGMMYLTPYQMKIGDMEKELSYIIGVGTKKEFRHQGIMNELLIYSFQRMYEKRQAFTYLMPANPAIYMPYQFRYIYEKRKCCLNQAVITDDVIESLLLERMEVYSMRQQKRGELQAASKPSHKLLFQRLEPLDYNNLEDGKLYITCCNSTKDLEEVSVFASHWLACYKEVYAMRTIAYYEMQLKEIQAQNGGIFMIKDGEKLVGFFLYAKEGELIEIQEAMILPEYERLKIWIEEKEQPLIMARIICVEEMLALLKSRVKQTVDIRVIDAQIPQNNDIFQCVMSEKGSQVCRIKEHNKDLIDKEELIIICKVEELVEMIFGKKSSVIPNLIPFEKVFINEIV